MKPGSQTATYINSSASLSHRAMYVKEVNQRNEIGDEGA